MKNSNPTVLQKELIHSRRFKNILKWELKGQLDKDTIEFRTGKDGQLNKGGQNRRQEFMDIVLTSVNFNDYFVFKI